MSYRDPDELASLRSRVEQLESQLEPQPPKEKPPNASLLILTVAILVFGIVFGISSLMTSCERETQTRCRHICAVNGLEIASTRGDGCGPDYVFTECVCSRRGMDGGVIRVYGAADGRERPH